MTDANRRDLLIAPLLMALPQLLMAGSADAAPDPSKTIIVPPKDLVFKTSLNAPPKSIEVADIYSKQSEPGLYMNLTKWYPGWMSAPHFYETDRVCVVVSGTWWATSGDDFDPNSTVPVEAGSFVRRVAHTSHYDGVKAGEKEPVIIAICGIGPIKFHAVDPSKPAVRQV
jgi:hypothetical protein